MAELDGKKIAFLVTDYGVEEAELAGPRAAVIAAGATATIVGTTGETIQTLVGDRDPGITFAVDEVVDEVRAHDFDMLVIPGGTVNADRLRLNKTAIALVTSFANDGKPIAAICHGPWALVEAGILHGKTLTSYPSLRTDITNAGGDWHDREVEVSDSNGWTLVTSRTPKDVPAFSAAVISACALVNR